MLLISKNQLQMQRMKAMDKTGVIYILTNPSFPEYVKIGYADDIDKRLQQLNRSECIPFAFRVYATYEVNSRLSDLKIHSIIDKLNPNLRSIENFLRSAWSRWSSALYACRRRSERAAWIWES